MKVWIAVLHGLALALVNLAAIFFGFLVYNLVRPANQIAVQGPIAALLSIAGVLVWAWLSSRLGQGRYSLAAAKLLWVFLASLAWLPAIFMPLHLATQGYVSSFDNILVGWVFQAPVNALALALLRLPPLREPLRAAKN